MIKFILYDEMTDKALMFDIDFDDTEQYAEWKIQDGYNISKNIDLFIKENFISNNWLSFEGSFTDGVNVYKDAVGYSINAFHYEIKDIEKALNKWKVFFEKYNKLIISSTQR